MMTNKKTLNSFRISSVLLFLIAFSGCTVKHNSSDSEGDSNSLVGQIYETQKPFILAGVSKLFNAKKVSFFYIKSQENRAAKGTEHIVYEPIELNSRLIVREVRKCVIKNEFFCQTRLVVSLDLNGCKIYPAVYIEFPLVKDENGEVFLQQEYFRRVDSKLPVVIKEEKNGNNLWGVPTLDPCNREKQWKVFD